MIEYPKIQSVFKRDPETKYATFLEGQYSLPEFAHLKDTLWRFEEKIDGTNIRIMSHSGEEGIKYGGRTAKAEMPTFLIEKLIHIYIYSRSRLDMVA